MRSHFLFSAAVMAVMALTPAITYANDPHAHHHGQDHGQAAPHDVYAKAMDDMHKGMSDVKPTGDADVDFVKGMIPHHQGAVDMAKILLEKGKDPELRQLAKDIIASQEKEITMMQRWLKEHQE